MSEQTALALDTPNPSKPTARLTGGYYRPPITPMGISTVDRVEYAQNKATGLPGWAFHLAAKPGAGAVDVWFARDETNLTLFCDNHNIKLPTVGKLACNWRLEWHKAGYQNVIDAIEILPQEEPVTAPAATRSELDEALDRKPDGSPADDKPAHETDPVKCKFAMPAHVKRVHGLDDATTGRAIRTIFGMALPDALVKLGVAKCWQLIEDYDTANKPDEVAARFAPSQAPEAPPAGAAAAGATGTPETVARAANRPVEAKETVSTPVLPTPEVETKPSAIIPYQPKAVAHTLNVNWQVTPLEMAQFAVQSKLYSGIDTAAKAMIVMMRGLELGVSPLTALEQVNIIQGKTAVSSALFLALIERSGQLENIVIDDSKPDACTVTLTRRGRTPITATFTMDDARQMGLANKDNWRRMPKTMLYHRALGVAGRRAFSDILLFGGGIYMAEELAPDTVVDENGDVIAA